MGKCVFNAVKCYAGIGTIESQLRGKCAGWHRQSTSICIKFTDVDNALVCLHIRTDKSSMGAGVGLVNAKTGTMFISEDSQDCCTGPHPCIYSLKCEVKWQGMKFDRTR